MIPETRSFPRARGLLFGALALTAILAACEASMPTAADVKQMDVVSLEKNAQAVGFDGLANAHYFIDGKPATAAEAKALGPEKIASVRVMKALAVKDGEPRDAGGVSEVRIVTKDAPEGTDEISVEALRAEVKAHPGAKIMIRQTEDGKAIARVEGQESFARLPEPSLQTGPKPLFLIDGVVADEAAMKALGPDRIESIDVLKGPAAEKEYGARGANGVIKITTKK